MDSPPSGNSVGIFDDFEEPRLLDSTYCKRVSEEEYSDCATSETDKALGELCLLLDKNPEIYAKILRKRKREEIESDGFVSFLKSKVLGLVQGDEYSQNLVSDMECMEQTNALKVGICRTFQYAQELKDEPVRRSQRNAAKNKMANNKTDKIVTGTKRAQNLSGHNPQTPSNGTKGLQCSDGGDRSSEKVLLSGVEEKEEENTAKRRKFDDENTTAPDDVTGSSKPKNVDTVEVEEEIEIENCLSNQMNQQTTSLNQALPPPPPPPPLPASMTSNLFNDMSPVIMMQKLTPNALKNVPSSRLNSLSVVTRGKRAGRRNLSSPVQSKSDESVLSRCETLKMTRTPRNHKRSISNTSLRSASSMGSLTSIHSELMSSNPITRLKATSIARSPGGTPVRTSDNIHNTSQPLHQALVSAVKSKFKNIYTPSPRSALSSTNTSFSP